jgi:hypothetical protein
MADRAIELFYSYARDDERLLKRLHHHLALLQRQGLIRTWHDRRISAGSLWEQEIDIHLKLARVILLLVSSAFIASDYCYSTEVKEAMRRHEAGESVVIPIILRPCDWKVAPFARLQVLPKDAKPITQWSNRDAAFDNVAQGIRKIVEEAVEKYQEGLHPSGIRSKEKSLPVVLKDSQAALKKLTEFAKNTDLEYAYQMLLLLVMLSHSDGKGVFSVEVAACCFSEFYRLRKEAGFSPVEKKRGGKTAVVDEPNVSLNKLKTLVKTRPFPRFERAGLLELSEDEMYFLINPTVLKVLTLDVKDMLRKFAISRMAAHFEEDETRIEERVMLAIGS